MRGIIRGPSPPLGFRIVCPDVLSYDELSRCTATKRKPHGNHRRPPRCLANSVHGDTITQFTHCKQPTSDGQKIWPSSTGAGSPIEGRSQDHSAHTVGTHAETTRS